MHLYTYKRAHTKRENEILYNYSYVRYDHDAEFFYCLLTNLKKIESSMMIISEKY